MTETMKRYLTLASKQYGSPVRNFADHQIAERNGWVRFWGYHQNSMNARYVITEEGRAALAAA